MRKVEDFLNDPWGIRVRDGEKGTTATVQVAVPRIAPPPPPPPLPLVPPPGDAVDEEAAAAAAAAAASAQAKRAALQRKAAAAMVAAEDYARRFESGDLMVRFFQLPLDLGFVRNFPFGRFVYFVWI